MKNTFKIFLGCAVLVSSLTAGTVRSAGTAGAAQLLIPVGAETIALSGANVGTVAGVDAFLVFKELFQPCHILLTLMSHMLVWL